MDTGVLTSLFGILFLRYNAFASTDQKTITGQSGQNATMTCRAPNNNFTLVQWSRADLEPEHVAVYKGGQFLPDHQHPSFKNRVDLQDRQMKDGDVSLILKNATSADSGKYECRVFNRGTVRRKRALSKIPPISIIHLSVVDPPGQTGGHTEDGGKEDGVNKHYGLIPSGLLLLVLVVVLVKKLLTVAAKVMELLEVVTRVRELLWELVEVVFNLLELVF
ncbi:coxsackievirus and adenovirus receptor-like [Maylandia zebra]|uniref:coxsackievirus and adenovirus receptor-like n=1 Tax=Maylandia zebra TaxID=106582 RepID=UPI00403CFCC3